MDFKVVKGKKHYLYDSIQEFRIHHPDEPLNENWRKAKEGEWVVTDDQNVCQILKCYDLKINMSKKVTKCSRTVLGTFRVDNHNIQLLGADGIAENIYTFSRTYKAFKQYQKDGLKPKEFVFARYVKKMVKEEIKKVLEEENVSANWIVSRYKDIADLADKDSDKLRSLDSLSKISGLFDTETKQEQLTVWSGFTSEQMEALKDGNKTELIGHKEREQG